MKNLVLRERKNQKPQGKEKFNMFNIKKCSTSMDIFFITLYN